MPPELFCFCLYLLWNEDFTDNFNMSDPLAYADLPLWSRFLRWCTIQPKRHETSIKNLILVPHDNGSRLESLPEYEYTPLKDPEHDARLIELLSDRKFDDDIKIRIHHVTLTASPREGD